MAAPERPPALGRFPKAKWNAKRRCWVEGAFWYDDHAADAAVAFFHDHLVFTKGEWAGRPFRLEGWQEHDIVRPLFGWKRADSTRRFRRCYIWVARKNGKTELAAGIALLMLLGDAEPGAEVYSIAAEKEQASIVFDKAVVMVEQSNLPSAPPYGAGLEAYANSIYWPEQNASFRALSGKPKGKHGLNMSGLVGDEVHEWVNGDLYKFVHDSARSRRQPLEVMISTAGVRGGYGETIFGECQSMLTGEIDVPDTLVIIYAAGPEDDWTKPETWAKANPNLGISVKLESVAAECREAQQLPRLENDFRRYTLNQWTEQSVRWLPIDGVDDKGHRFGWDHCKGDVSWRDLEAKLLHKRCFGGLDLSAVTDLSALIWFFPVQDGLETPALLARFWKPADWIKEHSKRDKIPYDQLVKDGALLTTPGNVIDHEAIRRRVLEDAEKFKIAFRGEKRAADEGGLAIDRYDASETYVKLYGEGLPVVLFGQGFISMNAPAKMLERLVLSNGFHHGGHPLLRRHAQAVAVETDAAGNIKPSKDKSTLRIDGIVALCDALGIAAKDKGPQTSVYEGRGLRTI